MSERNALSSVKKIFDYWKPWLEQNDRLTDIPRCFACGLNTKHLERHHLVTVQDAGTDELENLVLLCKKCHKKIPDLYGRYASLKWMGSREWFVEDLAVRLADALDAVVPKTENEAFAQWMLEQKLDKPPWDANQDNIFGLIASMFETFKAQQVAVEARRGSG